MKLELKHVCPYLPYEVRYLQELTNAPLRLNPRDVLYFIQTEQKLLLRPLSSLTKEIEHNGERFVPMVNLLEMYERNEFNKDESFKLFGKNIKVNILDCKSNFYSSSNSTEHQVRYAFETSNMGTLIYSFTYCEKFDRFAFRDETSNRPLGTAYQIQLFAKLAEWHIDYQDLIPAGLAIPIED